MASFVSSLLRLFRSRRPFTFATPFALILFLSVPQLSFGPATGITPFGNFNRDAIDTINDGNLNVHFQFPIFAKKGVGLDFYANLTNDASSMAQNGNPYLHELESR